MIVERAILRAFYAPRARAGLGQVDTSQMLATVSTPQGSYQVAKPEFRSLIVNAISHNWQFSPGPVTEYPQEKWYVQVTGSTDAGKALEQMVAAGKWVFVHGSPFQVSSDLLAIMALIPFDTEAQIVKAQQRFSASQNSFLLAPGGPSEPGAVDKLKDSVEHELSRAELGLRWGSLAGAVIGLGIIASVEAKRRLRR